MKQEIVLTHEFVEYIPNDLKERTIYVSMAFATVVHKCCCGCGNEVVTPLSPTDWKLIFDGHSVSLHPSIGNWNFACQSHYWIRGNKVKWASQWSQEEINAGRFHDSLAKEKYFSSTKTLDVHDAIVSSREVEAGTGKPKRSLWQKLKRWLFRANAS
ncbi:MULTISPECIES: DUF6527 family protein [Fischerella]|uniref:DUF6527 family protein n=1 Tax=Fischerella TaxID=1190 RepID=UPI000366C408|nr:MULTISPECIES: DUF6527 family protein [Fischerella]MBD2432407.1 hypothetical protein [Fischerella sp. FACHB-380]